MLQAKAPNLSNLHVLILDIILSEHPLFTLYMQSLYTSVDAILCTHCQHNSGIWISTMRSDGSEKTRMCIWMEIRTAMRCSLLIAVL